MGADLSNIRIITVSGRIGCGSTTLAKGLAERLEWRHIEGGEVFWEEVRKKMGISPKDTNMRPDEEDRVFDEHLKKILQRENHIILETKLAGFNAQGISGVFKILLVCNDREGRDQTEIRIDRLVNREDVTVDEAKLEVLEREANDVAKWRNMYAPNDPKWIYYDVIYYDCVINTFTHNQEETLRVALKALGQVK